MGGRTEISREGRTNDPTRSGTFGQAISRIDSRPPEGVLMLAMATVFFTGMAVGGFLFAYTDQPPLRMAANDIVTAPGSQPAPSIAR